MEMAEEMGVELLDEEQYRHLQTLGEFDTKTSSWIKTPDDVRKLGGALFGDRRYGASSSTTTAPTRTIPAGAFVGCLRCRRRSRFDSIGARRREVLLLLGSMTAFACELPTRDGCPSPVPAGATSSGETRTRQH